MSVFEWLVLAQKLTIFEALQTFQQGIQLKEKALQHCSQMAISMDSGYV
jgi:hypothetical protein